MDYLYNVYCLFSPSEELPYYFHEWKRGDRIRMLNAVPFVKVNEELYSHLFFATEFDQLPENFHINLSNLCKEAIGNSVYYHSIAIVSDGKSAFAIMMDKEKKKISKSRLVIKQECKVAELLRFKLPVSYDMEGIKLSTSNHKIFGLTRREREARDALLEFLSSTSDAEEPKLKYIISELDIESYQETSNSAGCNTKEIFAKAVSKIDFNCVKRIAEIMDLIDAKCAKRLREVIGGQPDQEVSL